MLRRILVVTYALREELDVDYLMQHKNNLESALLARATTIDRIKWRLLGHKPVDVVFVETGVGKLNSYSRLKSVLDEILKDKKNEIEIEVLNLGTAASVGNYAGRVFYPTQFEDRDLAKLSSTGYTSGNKVESIESIVTMISRPHICICNSGDTFVTSDKDLNGCDTVDKLVICDMEAHSQAVLSKDTREIVHFRSFKYITDVVGENSIECWEDRLSDANRRLTDVCKDRISDFYIFHLIK